MPKLSQAKRHRRQLDLVSACCSGVVSSNPFNQQNNPRKVSEEDISNTTSSSSSQDGASSPLTPPQGAALQRVESMPRLKRRKPSSCLTDLVSAGAAPQTPSPSPCWYGEEEQQASPLVSATMMEQGQSSCEEQPHPCHPAATCISPIWGQFVDMILEQEEEDQPQQAKHDGRSWSPPPHADTELSFSFLGGPTRVSAAEAAAPKYPVSAPPALTTTTSSWKGLVSSSDTLLTPSYHPSPHHHDPYPQHALLWHKKKQPRQRILSPQRVLLEQQQDKEHSGRSPVLTSSPSFVLQDPASLPEALARLRV